MKNQLIDEFKKRDIHFTDISDWKDTCFDISFWSDNVQIQIICLEVGIFNSLWLDQVRPSAKQLNNDRNSYLAINFGQHGIKIIWWLDAIELLIEKGYLTPDDCMTMFTFSKHHVVKRKDLTR